VFGPGAYRPDPTEGITAIADLPQPEIIPYSRNDTRNVCPRCGHVAYRGKQSQRTLHDVGNLDLWCPRDLVVTYSQHYLSLSRLNYSWPACEVHPEMMEGVVARPLCLQRGLQRWNEALPHVHSPTGDSQQRGRAGLQARARSTS
jgi:hypothetical protein